MTKKRAAGKRGNNAPGGERSPDPLTPELLVRTLKDVHKPLKIDDFLRILALPRREKKQLEFRLHELVASGRALRLSGGGYTLASALKTATGFLSMQRSGVGFVKLDRPAKGEVFISSNHLGQAWHGDHVEVVILPARGRDTRGKNRDGRIVRVLERAMKELVVRVVRNLSDGTSLAESTDGRIAASFFVDVSPLDVKPSRNALLRVRPGEARGVDLWDALALDVLGDENSVTVQEELVKANHAIPRAFPPDVIREAASFPDAPDASGKAGRRDLSKHPFVTIDGATARDFDDAVYVERTPRGHILYVAIADVAHYVRPASALDDEAYARGNSYYFPRSVEPMLPEALSNGLCSLNPGVPRLAMVAEMAFSDQGAMTASRFYPAVITSAGRLTYDETRDALITGDEAARKRLAAHLPMLEDALDLARILAAKRKERGSLDFDLPEPEGVFDDAGFLVAIEPRDNHFIHKMIEVFMVAANEAVAEFLTGRDMPVLYRVHPAPDPEKLLNVFRLFSATGLAGAASLSQDFPALRKDSAPPAPGRLQALLDKAKGTPHEYLVSRVALRSMMQAGYSQDLEGHFGLASDCYCHFTSPIRRYADLVVHRSLKAALDAPDKSRLPGRKKLQEIADHINATERTAMDAEREMTRRMSVIFMSDRVGETFSGIVSGLTEFGIFVELAGVMTEGMVRLMDIDDDYYVYYPDFHELRGERTGRTYRLGQPVTVRVTDVSMARLEINLAFAGDERALPRKRGRKGSRRGR